jgi:hypothetical protein
MRKLLKGFFTGVDGETPDLGRVLWALAVLAMLGVATVQILAQFLNLWNHTNAVNSWSARDWAEWAAATGALLPLGAGALALKARTEPGAPPPPPNIIMPPAASSGPNVTVNN